MSTTDHARWRPLRWYAWASAAGLVVCALFWALAYSKWPKVTKDGGPIVVGVIAVLLSGGITVWSLIEQRRMADADRADARDLAEEDRAQARDLAETDRQQAREIAEADRAHERRMRTYAAVRQIVGTPQSQGTFTDALGGQVLADASPAVLGALDDWWHEQNGGQAVKQDWEDEPRHVKWRAYVAMQVMAEDLRSGDSAAFKLWQELRGGEPPVDYDRQRFTPPWRRA